MKDLCFSTRVDRTLPRRNDICMVTLRVLVAMKHSDKIPDTLDDHGDPITYKSGLVMKVLGNQEFVYEGEKLLVIGTMKEEGESEE